MAKYVVLYTHSDFFSLCVSFTGWTPESRTVIQGIYLLTGNNCIWKELDGCIYSTSLARVQEKRTFLLPLSLKDMTHSQKSILF
jgi:hypothetical protein